MPIINFTTESDADFVRGFIWKYTVVDPGDNSISYSPIDLTGMKLKMGVRKNAVDATEAMSLTTENGGIAITDELNGRFLVNFNHAFLLILPPGIYVHSLIAISPDDSRMLVWTGTLTHSIGPSR